MIAFEVSLNGERLCTAGVGDVGVLSSVVSFVRRRAAESDDTGEFAQQELSLAVEGFVGDEHLRWIERSLVAGDTLTIRVSRVERADDPAARSTHDPEEVAHAERGYFEHLKQRYEPSR